MNIFLKNKNIIYLILFVGLGQLITSCRFLSPGIMLRTGPSYPYEKFDTSTFQYKSREYRISINDKVSIQLFSDGGSSLINVVSGTGVSGGGNFGGNTNQIANITSSTNSGGMTYNVDFDGTVRIPIIGRVKLIGMTVREAQDYLEKRFSEYYNNPFVMLTINNRRVIVFNGSGTTSSVVQLTQENMTLFEVIAQLGGITEEGKAYRVKLIRGDLKKPQVYLIDLSTLKGIQAADLTMQGNDIIYIETIQNYPEKFLARMAPYLSAINTAILTYAFVAGYLYPKSTTNP